MVVYLSHDPLVWIGSLLNEMATLDSQFNTFTTVSIPESQVCMLIV